MLALLLRRQANLAHPTLIGPLLQVLCPHSTCQSSSSTLGCLVTLRGKGLLEERGILEGAHRVPNGEKSSFACRKKAPKQCQALP
eukprot:m.272883 g.272883  ORF g.272883 m.272883 type:complete len:85 (+) comp40568_c0_seq12:494-748(+)